MPAEASSATGKDAKLSAQREHGNFPRSLKEPPATSVRTIVEYLVLVLIEQAVTAVQSQFTKGYSVVPAPIVITTGALIVVSAGIVCATTMQYLQPLLYVAAGILIVNVPSAKVTAEEIIKLRHKRLDSQ